MKIYRSKDETLEARLYAKITKGETPDDCWGWSGATYPFGYGNIATSKGNEGAHRVSYRLNTGSIPDGMCVLHRCDNPRCNNPKHLFLGTQKDNAIDRNSKGRGKNPRHVGEKNHNAKLTADEARLIASSDLLQADLSRTFGVSINQIGRIQRGERWSSVQ